ncbi:hypothetical protein UlMin_035143 [Ulmus minor]
MDKSCQSSADSTNITGNSRSGGSNSSGRDQYIKHLNKLSHKISKPFINKPTFDPSLNHQAQPQVQAQALPPPPPPTASQAQNLPSQHQHQPPVYNINKSDFRDVVQKLTGSPAHDRFSTPPPIQPPKAPSSRLQRIRPPPLAQLSNRPPLLNSAVPPQQLPTDPNPSNPMAPPNFGGIGRPGAPLSPLPPLPAVHAAAESPVSAYMRYLQNSMAAADSNQKHFSGFSPLAPLVSPRWNNLPPPPQQGNFSSAPPPAMLPPHSSFPQFPMPPSSPLPFGCMNSPRSQFPLLSPSLLLSPSSGGVGFPQLPLSPTVPVPSPRWRGF